MANNNQRVVRQLSIFINDREVVNSLSGITREMSRVNNQLRNLNAGSETYEEDLHRLQGELSELTERQSEFREEIRGTSEDMTAAAGAWGNLFNGLTTGNLTQAAAGFTAIRTGIAATTRALFAFIATPVGAFITVLAGIALATKEWLKYNEAVVKANVETQAITKLSGDALNAARVNAKVLADTFDVEFKDVLETARALVNEFGISYDEAFERIENGLIKGGAANGEFLDSLREYPTFFSQAGFAVEEFQNLINTGIDLGIYQDKLPDAIKEFALSITEQTQAAKDALQNAFGTEFTTNLLKGVKDGSISVKEALGLVANEAERIGLNSQQAQQLTADLFRGAGEDAGGAIKIFEAYNKSIENIKRPLSEVEQAVQDLTTSHKDLEEAQDRALNSDGYNKWKTNILIAFNQVKQGFYDTIAFLTNTEEELANRDNAKFTAQWAKDGIKELEFYLDLRKKRLGDQYDFEEVKEEHLESLRKQYRDIAKAGSFDATEEEKEMQKRFEVQIKAIEEYQEKVKKTTNANDINEINARKKANEDKLKELQRQHEKEEAERKRAYEAQVKALDAANKEIDEILKKSQEDRQTSQLTGLQKEIKQIENRYATEIEKYDKFLGRRAELEQARDAEIQAAKEAKAKEYGLQIDEINQQLDRDREAYFYDQAASKAKTEQEKQLLLLEKARAIADLELQSEQEKELAKVEEVENAEALKQAIYDKYAQKKLDNDLKFAESEKAIRKDQVKFTDLTEKQKLAFITTNLNSVADAFNQGSNAWKAIKIAETGITTAQSAMEAYRGMVFAFPGPLGIGLGVAAAAATTVRGIRQMREIANTKIQQAPRFRSSNGYFDGGYTGDNVLWPDEHGGAVGYVHKKEWVAPEVMTQSPRYANTFAWLENERKRLKGKFDGGFTSTPSSAPVVPAENPVNDRLVSAVEALTNVLDNGIMAKTYIGYDEAKGIQDLNDERYQSNQNGKLNT